MIELRDYQKALARIGYDFLKDKRNLPPSVIVAPCGSGKSLIIGAISAYLNEPLLCIQPSVELLQQNSEKAKMYGVNISIYSASAGSKKIGKLTYATMGSIKTKAELFKKAQVKHIIIDECEKGVPPEEGGMFVEFINKLKPKKILGLTASPFRNKRYGTISDNWTQLNVITRTNPRIFKNILEVMQIQDIVRMGYWCNTKYEVWNYDTSGLELNSTGSDYTDESIIRKNRDVSMNNKIYIRLTQLIKEGKKSILVFMDSVDNAIILSDFMNKKGFKTDVVDGKLAKKERMSIIEKFRNGHINIVINYSAIMQGFDNPSIDAVIFGRRTLSLNVWMQALGRGVRLDPKNKDKECLMIDCCNNYEVFGRMEDIRIENYLDKGFCVFNKNRQLSGVRLDSLTDAVKKKDRYKTNLVNFARKFSTD